MGEIDQPPVTDVINATVLTTQGDIVVRGATEPGKLAIGTAGQILKVNAGADALEYGDTPINFHKARVHISTAVHAIASASLVKVPFDTADFDPYSMHDNVNDRFTPDLPGYYLVKAIVSIDTVNVEHSLYAAVQKNGANTAVFATMKGWAVNGYVSLAVFDTVYCDGSTDYIEIWASQSSGSAGSFSTSVLSHFEIIGPF